MINPTVFQVHFLKIPEHSFRVFYTATAIYSCIITYGRHTNMLTDNVE